MQVGNRPIPYQCYILRGKGEGKYKLREKQLYHHNADSANEVIIDNRVNENNWQDID